jgi:hypothetical protein
MVDLNETSFDAQRVAEAVATGEQSTANVNVSQDYANSKAFDGPSNEQTESDRDSDSPPSVDPEEFRSMAKDVNPFLEEAAN